MQRVWKLEGYDKLYTKVGYAKGQRTRDNKWRQQQGHPAAKITEYLLVPIEAVEGGKCEKCTFTLARKTSCVSCGRSSQLRGDLCNGT